MNVPVTDMSVIINLRLFITALVYELMGLGNRDGMKNGSFWAKQ